MEKYDIQTINIQPDDIVLFHVSEDLDLDELSEIQRELNNIFPNNKVILVNQHILKGVSILKPEKTETVSVEHIMENDLNEFLKSMEYHYDYLH